MKIKTMKSPTGMALVGLVCVLSLQLQLLALAAEEKQPVALESGGGGGQDIQRQEAAARIFNENVRVNFKLPKMFDFEKFKSTFKKIYSSSLEEMVRLKFFLARSYRAFISAVGYKNRDSSYYLAVNERSDWTPEELAASENKFLEGDPEGQKTQNALATEDNDKRNVEAQDPVDLELIDPEELERELESIERRSSEPRYAQLAEELRKMRDSPRPRLRRSIQADDEQTQVQVESAVAHNGQRDNFDIAQAFERSTGKLTSKRTSERIKSNNPDYEPPELMSMGGGSPDYRKHPKYQVPLGRWAAMGKKRDYSQLPVKSKYKTVTYADTFWSWFGYSSSSEKLNVSPGAQKLVESTDSFLGDRRIVGTTSDQSNDDVLWVDHRVSKCLADVQDQGRCGSCYLFATTAFLEHAYCRETGKLAKFSEQYALDCGSKINMQGCEGGNIDRSVEFYANFGVELASHYAYKARQEMCPYGPETEMTHMGYIRLDVVFMSQVPIEKIENYLEMTPMVINIDTSGDFQEYGGGVWDGRQCQPRQRHSMLLIGHGREDGEEYWLIRNSYGPSWGEAGHIKLNKNSDCIHPHVGWIWGARNGFDVHLWPRRNEHVKKPVVKDRTYRMKNLWNGATNSLSYAKSLVAGGGGDNDY